MAVRVHKEIKGHRSYCPENTTTYVSKMKWDVIEKQEYELIIQK
jgi:hypothetical protein